MDLSLVGSTYAVASSGISFCNQPWFGASSWIVDDTRAVSSYKQLSSDGKLSMHRFWDSS
ncbi:hypothetical protein BDA96_09G159600 [Sorghum bicolor]|uniref:Uncharacterized protein n=2 Tax=Sorghum bicolor TaxID=4558 RepID=A0A921QAR8_SORBI|nr:hypothetical protein BDA96_09G159600 [Sorghum bicolor]OQU78089.1 hypothetical protein SORBI_3009G152120 [Sorghum bicolor]